MAFIRISADTMFPHGTGRSSGFRDALQQTVTDREAVYFAYSHRLSFLEGGFFICFYYTI